MREGACSEENWFMRGFKWLRRLRAEERLCLRGLVDAIIAFLCIVPLKYIEYGFGYIITRFPYSPISYLL